MSRKMTLDEVRERKLCTHVCQQHPQPWTDWGCSSCGEAFDDPDNGCDDCVRFKIHE